MLFDFNSIKSKLAGLPAYLVIIWLVVLAVKTASGIFDTPTAQEEIQIVHVLIFLVGVIILPFTIGLAIVVGSIFMRLPLLPLRLLFDDEQVDDISLIITALLYTWGIMSM